MRKLAKTAQKKKINLKTNIHIQPTTHKQYGSIQNNPKAKMFYFNETLKMISLKLKQ